MFKKLTTAALAASLIFGTATVTATSASAATPTASVQVANVAKYVMPASGTALRKEAAKFKTSRYLPMDEYTKVTYLGTASKRYSNGKDIWSKASGIRKGTYHHYRIVLDETKMANRKRSCHCLSF